MRDDALVIRARRSHPLQLHARRTPHRHTKLPRQFEQLLQARPARALRNRDPLNAPVSRTQRFQHRRHAVEMRLVRRSLNPLRKSSARFIRVIRTNFIAPLTRANVIAPHFITSRFTATHFIATRIVTACIIAARCVCVAPLINARCAALASLVRVRRSGFRFVPAKIFHVSKRRGRKYSSKRP
jgi:hypothetical protein